MLPGDWLKLSYIIGKQVASCDYHVTMNDHGSMDGIYPISCVRKFSDRITSGTNESDSAPESACRKHHGISDS